MTMQEMGGWVRRDCRRQGWHGDPMSPVRTWLLVVLALPTFLSVEALCHPGTHRSYFI